MAKGGFFEWAEFLDNLYGTPVPDPPPGSDVLLEIDVQGAEQVLAQRPDATVILLLPRPPRSRRSGWRPGATTRQHIGRRRGRGHEEGERASYELAAHVVVNDDLPSGRRRGGRYS